MFTFLPPALAVAFIAVQQGLFGLHVGCAFAPNHKGTPILRRDEELDFLRRPVLTWRNVPRGRPLVDQELRSAISTPAAGCGLRGGDNTCCDLIGRAFGGSTAGARAGTLDPHKSLWTLAAHSWGGA